MNDEEYILPILEKYYNSFRMKTYSAENSDFDVLMDIYNITPAQKQAHKQFWSRELGMMWQLIVTTLCQHHC